MYGNKSSPRRRRAPKIIQYHLLTQQETGQNAKMAFPEQSQHEGSVNYFNNREKGGANVFVREIEREIKEIAIPNGTAISLYPLISHISIMN